MAAIGGQVALIGVLEGFEVVAPAGAVSPKNVTIQGISVGHRRALAELVAALDHLDRGPFGKIVIEMAVSAHDGLGSFRLAPGFGRWPLPRSKIRQTTNSASPRCSMPFCPNRAATP